MNVIQYTIMNAVFIQVSSIVVYTNEYVPNAKSQLLQISAD